MNKIEIRKNEGDEKKFQNELNLMQKSLQLEFSKEEMACKQFVKFSSQLLNQKYNLLEKEMNHLILETNKLKPQSFMHEISLISKKIENEIFNRNRYYNSIIKQLSDEIEKLKLEIEQERKIRQQFEKMTIEIIEEISKKMKDEILNEHLNREHSHKKLVKILNETCCKVFLAKKEMDKLNCPLKNHKITFLRSFI